MSEYMEYNWIQGVVSPEVKHYSESATKDAGSSISCLRNSFLSCIELKDVTQLSDKSLLRFLYARKFNIDESLELLKKYYLHRKERPDIFKGFTLEAPDIKYCLSNSLPGVLPLKDRKGRSILIVIASNWEGDYCLLSIYRSILVCLEYLTAEIHTQTNGVVFIVDWTEFPFRRSLSLKPTILKMMIEGLQNCFPVRYKGIHFVNQPWYVETALTCIKPFLKDDIKDKIYFHGNNLSSLHDHVHKDILPTELGGEQPSFNPNIWMNTLKSDIPT